MQPTADTDYKSLFTQLIKKQILVLGPDITLAKVRNVTGLVVDINGEVQKIDGEPQLLLQALINQFVELSGLIVKKTMESILTSYPGMMAMAATGALGTPVTTGITQPIKPSEQVVTSTPIQVTETTVPLMSTDLQSVTSEPIKEASVFTNEVEATPKISEPPPMSSVHLDSLNVQSPADNKKEVGESFTQSDMNDLNKALDELSKAPLSTEKPTAV